MMIACAATSPSTSAAAAATDGMAIGNDAFAVAVPLADQALVSVIMPAYNAAPYIAEAIRSVLDQNYPDIELIVVDDGSQDGTPEIARGFGERVRLFERPNGGPAAARNFGFSVARGEFIAFLDADDLWLPGKLASQVAHLRAHPEIGVVFGKFLRWYGRADGRFDAPPAPQDDSTGGAIVSDQSGWIYTELLFDNIVHIITAVIRREVLDIVGGFDETLRTGEDYDFWLRVSRRVRADKLNRTLAWYRMHPQSITRIPRSENNELRVLRKALEDYGPTGPDGRRADSQRLRDRLFDLCFSHGYMHYWVGDAKVARQAFSSALDYNHLRFKPWVYLGLALLRDIFGVRLGKSS